MFKKALDHVQKAFGSKPTSSCEDAVNYLHSMISEYVDWYCEKGLYLPEEFRMDPATWTDILRKIQRAFDLAHTREYIGDVGLKAEMKEGFELFGKYFLELWK